jgi:hypothetical protein
MGRTLKAIGILFSPAVLLGAPLAGAQVTSTGGNYTQPAAGPPVVAYGAELPPELPGMAFGMAKDKFVDIIMAKNLTPVTNTAKTMFLVQPPGAPYKSVVYFFDSNAGPILSEIELRFADEAHALAYYLDKYPGQYGPGSDYVHNDSKLGYAIKAWCNQTKIYVVATMPNTRWSTALENSGGARCKG